ncbi:hypothetical protein Terro_0220 [Terriglobus roseus DSM 18391]|uniref:Uncharacterized protein n=1 Tax=Terriglobus roseus (strain DSM 18391 / NRRL B-41598 / KBS 63) TaxID=926566 RepID=I3ZBF2_TERRK|nr:hypothetical protein Terro_0220 [Terriglobus roseus DSM 18391]
MQYRKLLLTLLFAVLTYKLMVTAFSLMNKPSDTALYWGELLLAVSVIGFLAMVRLLWRRSMR